jgi:hypothetical protein
MNVLRLLLIGALVSHTLLAQTKTAPKSVSQKIAISVASDGSDEILSTVANSLRAALTQSKKFTSASSPVKSDVIVEVKAANLSDLNVEGNWAAISVIAFSKGRRIYHDVQIVGSRKAPTFGREILEELEERLR